MTESTIYNASFNDSRVAIYIDVHKNLLTTRIMWSDYLNIYDTSQKLR